MKPVYERILIKPLDEEKKTEGGILLPKGERKRPNIGKVVAAGDGIATNPMVVKEGDVILCNRYAGVELNYKGEKHYVIMSNEVIAILDDEKDVTFDY